MKINKNKYSRKLYPVKRTGGVFVFSFVKETVELFKKRKQTKAFSDAFSRNGRLILNGGNLIEKKRI